MPVRTLTVVAYCLLMFLSVPLPQALVAQTRVEALSPNAVLQPADPNKEPSEFNHHIAGWALIGVGMLLLASQSSRRLKGLRYALPLLFLCVGLFLAAWSDGEIWPRGNLNWLWLIHHDAEARQHKVYALLLIAIGIVEYFRTRGSLPKSWRMWAFPALALVGAAMLLVHDHTGGSGAHSPEAQAYLVNPMLDVDGTERGVTKPEPAPVPVDQASHNPADHAGTEHGAMAMDHSGMMMGDKANDSSHSGHHHEMSASMLMVQREHFWFMVVGIGIALFKFISDSKLFHTRVIGYIWPACMLLLGCALVVYRE